MSSIDQRPREPGKNEEQTGAVAHPSLPVQEMSTIQVALELAKRGIEVLSLSETEQRSKLTSVLQMVIKIQLRILQLNVSSAAG